jgi:hypothetical protein
MIGRRLIGLYEATSVGGFAGFVLHVQILNVVVRRHQS